MLETGNIITGEKEREGEGVRGEEREGRGEKEKEGEGEGEKCIMQSRHLKDQMLEEYILTHVLG